MKYFILNKIFRITILTLLCTAIVFQYNSQSHSHVKSTDNEPSLEAVKSIFPQTSQIKHVKENIFTVTDANNHICGTILTSHQFAPDYFGYAGPVPVIIGLNQNHTIAGVALTDNDETPRYLNRLYKQSFFDNWNNLTIDQAQKKEVQTISGATMSSSAVIYNVNKTLSTFTESGYQLAVSSGTWVNYIAFVLIMIMALTMYFVRKVRKYRLVLLVATGTIAGFWLKTTLSLAYFYGMAQNGIAAGSQIIPLTIIFFALLLPLLFNRAFFCSYLCPYGALQELVNKYSPFKVRTIIFLRKAEPSLRIILLSAAFIYILVEPAADLSVFEPFPAFGFTVSSIASLVIAGTFLILSLFVHKPWCQYLCPTGQLLDLTIVKHFDSQKKEVVSPVKLFVLFMAIILVITSIKTKGKTALQIPDKANSVQTENHNKKSLGSKVFAYPMPVMVIGTYDSLHVPNIMVCAWGGICNSKPAMISISLRKATYSYRSIVLNRAFTVNIPSAIDIEKADYAGIFSGRDENKFTTLGLTPIAGEFVSAPYVKEFPLNMECELVQTNDLGSHTQFIGQIKDVKMDLSIIKADGRIDMDLFEPTFFSRDGYYGIGKYLGQPFAIGKKWKAEHIPTK